MSDQNALNIASLETELETATGDRRIAIEASLRSLRNNGVRTDLEAQANEGIIDHDDLPADIKMAPLVSPPDSMPTSPTAVDEVPVTGDGTPATVGNPGVPPTPDNADQATGDTSKATAPADAQAGPPATDANRGK